MSADKPTALQLTTMFASRCKFAMDMLSWQLDPNITPRGLLISPFSVDHMFRRILTPETIAFVKELGVAHDKIAREICLMNNFVSNDIRLETKYTAPYRGIGQIETSVITQQNVLEHTLLFMYKFKR